MEHLRKFCSEKQDFARERKVSFIRTRAAGEAELKDTDGECPGSAHIRDAVASEVVCFGGGKKEGLTR